MESLEHRVELSPSFAQLIEKHPRIAVAYLLKSETKLYGTSNEDRASPTGGGGQLVVASSGVAGRPRLPALVWRRSALVTIAKLTFLTVFV